MEALIGLAILVAIPVAYFKLSDWFGTVIDRGLDRVDQVDERRQADRRAAEAADPNRKPGSFTRATRRIDKKLDEL